jgi:hypothetical protein
MRKKAAPGPRERAAIKARYDEILKDPKFRPRTDFPVGRQKFVEFVNEEFGEGPLPPPHLQVVRKESVQEDEKKVNEPHLQVVRKESVQEYEKKVDEPMQQAKRSEYKHGEAGEAFVNEQFDEGPLPTPHMQVVRKESVQEDEKKEKKVDELQQDNPEIPHLEVVRKESIHEGEKKEKKLDEPQQYNTEIPHLQVVRKKSVQEDEKKEKRVDELQQDHSEIPHLQVVRKESVQEGEKKEKKVDELQQDNPEIPHLQVVRKESIQEGEKKEKKVDEPQQDNPEIAQKRPNDGEDQSMAHAQLQLETDEHRDMTETPLVERCMNNFVGNPGGEEGEGAGVPEAAEEATAQHPHLLEQGQGRSKATTADIERAQIAQKRFYHEFTTENRDDNEDDDDDDHPVTHEPA